MVAAFQDWQAGHSPVSTGRAPWLPTPFLQAMRCVRGEINAAAAEKVRRGRR